MGRTIGTGRVGKLSARSYSNLVVPGPGDVGGGVLAFNSAWDTATGSSDSAVRNGTKWGSNNGNSTLLSVVSASGLGFPVGLTNVLSLSYDGVPNHYHQIHTTSAQIAAPAVGKYCYYRMFWRLAATGSQDLGQAHPWHGGDSAIYYSWHNQAVSGGLYPWNFRFQIGTPAYPNDRYFLNGNGGGGGASTGHTYCHQWCIQRTGTTTGLLRLRTSDIDGTALLDDDDYSQDGHTLLAGNPTMTVADVAFTELVLGNNDPNTTGVATVYVGAIAIRYSDSSNDWIGVSQVSGETW